MNILEAAPEISGSWNPALNSKILRSRGVFDMVDPARICEMDTCNILTGEAMSSLPWT